MLLDSDGLYEEHASFDSSDASSLSSTHSSSSVTDTASSSDPIPPTNNFDFLSTSKSNSRKSYNMIRFGYSSEEDEDDDFEGGVKSGKDVPPDDQSRSSHPDRPVACRSP